MTGPELAAAARHVVLMARSQALFDMLTAAGVPIGVLGHDETGALSAVLEKYPDVEGTVPVRIDSLPE